MGCGRRGKARPFSRWPTKAAPIVSWLLTLLLPAMLWARAGGGEGYHQGGGGGGGYGGGGGGGGGDGGGLGYLIYFLIQICFQHPVIGIPVLIIIIWVVVASSQQGNNAYQQSVIRRGGDVIDAAKKSGAISLLRQHDPQFSDTQFCQRVANAFNKIQAAWTAQDLRPVRPFISDGVHERFALQFAEQKDRGFRNVIDGLIINDIALADVASSGIFDEITVQIAASAADYRAALADNRWISGSRAQEPFVEYWSFLRRRGAVTDTSKTGLIEGNCPNCAAPIEMNESANCTNCKALLRSGEYDWVLTEITQESEWEPTATAPPPGLAQLRQKDPSFDPLAMEDLASVVFWRKVASDRLGKIDPLRKVSSEKLAYEYAKTLKPDDAGVRAFVGECAVGAVRMCGYLPPDAAERLERALVEVRWSGTRLTMTSGQVRAIGEDIIGRSLFVFGRNPGTATDAARSISSAHCPNCGAPVSDSASNACDYCNTVLNDAARGWILIAMPPYASPLGQNLLETLERGPAPAQTATNGRPPVSDAGLLAWAVKTAAADGRVDDEERRLLQTFATRRNMPPEQLERIINAALRGQIEVPEPADRDQAHSWLAAMVQTAQADGNISPEETSLLLSLGQRFGMSDYDVNLIVKQSRAQQYQAASAALRRPTGNNSNN